VDILDDVHGPGEAFVGRQLRRQLSMVVRWPAQITADATPRSQFQSGPGGDPGSPELLPAEKVIVL
jgi:hypothetical protein